MRLFLLTFVLVFAFGFVVADDYGTTAHVSTAVLEPEFTMPSVTNNYNVTICNEPGSDSLDEVRIIRNAEYTNLNCDDLSGDGWYLQFVSPWSEPQVGGDTEMCWYYTLNPANNIMAGDCRVFYFDATAPSEDPQECYLPWKFETRDQATDEGGAWNSIFDSTNIDSEAPETLQTILGPYKSDTIEGNFVEWIDGVSTVNLSARDLSEECGVGLEGTYWRNEVVDEGFLETHRANFDDLNAPCMNEDICAGLADIYSDEDNDMFAD